MFALEDHSLAFDFSRAREEVTRHLSSTQAARPTQEDSWDRIAEIIKISGCKCCPECGCRDFIRIKGRTIECADCKCTFSLTAGTIFHGVKQVELQLFIMELADAGIPFNSHIIHEVMNVAYSTVYNTVIRVSSAVIPSLTATIDAPTNCFLQTISKRSRATPAHKHPRFEEPAIAKSESSGSVKKQVHSFDQPKATVSNQNEGRLLQQNSDESQGLEQQILALLSTNPVSTDQLLALLDIDFPKLSCALTMLELDGEVQRQPGDSYILADRPSSSTISHEIAAVCDVAVAFLNNLFKGISRKYLQLYLALYWAFCDSPRRRESSLLVQCVARGKITGSAIVNTVCPPSVRVYSVLAG